MCNIAIKKTTTNKLGFRDRFQEGCLGISRPPHLDSVPFKYFQSLSPIKRGNSSTKQLGGKKKSQFSL